MARYFPNSKIVCAFVVDSISAAIQRRGYAAASQVAASSNGRSNVMMKKVVKESNETTTSWGPDPVTGYYRPESHVKEIDAAELRNMLLKHKPRQD
ncbi:protein SENESCENCE-ASSOCIATED 21, mitochondrial-like [Capsicum galapagoense]